MEQPYVYEQEDYEEGLTFKKVGYFFKKGWLRMLVYALVVALLTTAIAVPIKVFYKSEPLAQTSVEFIYEGIEEGHAPDGSTFNTDNLISTTVLAEAVSAAELDSVITDISKLREKMRVEGVESKEYADLVKAAADGDATAINTLRTYEHFPTRFTIIISEPKELNLSDDQAKALLDKIVACYYRDFQKRYSVSDMFKGDIYNLSENEQNEFFDMYDLYLPRITSMRTYLNDVSAKDPSFVSTKNSTTFSQLLSELSALENNYSTFNSYITSQNIWRDKNIAASTLKIKSQTLASYIEFKQAKADNLKIQIENFKPNIDQKETAGGTTTTSEKYPELYAELNEQLATEYEELRVLQNQQADVELRLNSLGELAEGEEKYPETDSALIAYALNQIKGLEKSSKELSDKVSATITDYYDTTFISSSVRMVLPPQVTRRSSTLNVLIIYLAAVIVALLAAALVTGMKISKANALKAKSENAVQVNAEQQPETSDEQSVKTEKKTDKK